MGRTDWGQIVFDKQLYTAKRNHKKIFVSLKILASELPEYIDAGWEKSKDYKSPKFVGISKEKPITNNSKTEFGYCLRVWDSTDLTKITGSKFLMILTMMT